MEFPHLYHRQPPSIYIKTYQIAMSDLLHIIIAEDNNKTRRMLFSKRKLQTFVFLTISLFITLTCASYYTLHFFNSNRSLDKQVQILSKELDNNLRAKETLTAQLQKLQKLHTRDSVQLKQLQQEKDVLIHTAVTELEERSSVIERIMLNIGITPEDIPKQNENSGGPFISSDNSTGQEVLYRSDRYIDTVNFIPLGRPVTGTITSGFGHRTEPINGKSGFHTGVDIQGRYGQKIIATADGVVKKSCVNGNYGQYVEISHANGYITKFAHMQKRLVKKGARVKRGQTIGTIGNTGRSTGPHLHYEICLYGNPINPNKFMFIKKLLTTPVKLHAKKNLKIKHTQTAANQASHAATLENRDASFQ